MALFASKTTRGFYDSAIHSTIPGDAVSITSQEHAALLEGQSDGSTIEWDDNGYPYLQAPAVPTRAELEEAAWANIKTERDRRTQLGGYQAAGNWFHSDTFSRSQIIGLVVMGANLPAGLMWKTMDGTFVEMTQTLAGQIFAAAAAQDQGVFTAAEVHRQTMIASEGNPLDYDYSAGWPLAYGE